MAPPGSAQSTFGEIFSLTFRPNENLGPFLLVAILSRHTRLSQLVPQLGADRSRFAQVIVRKYIETPFQMSAPMHLGMCAIVLVDQLIEKFIFVSKQTNFP